MALLLGLRKCNLSCTVLHCVAVKIHDVCCSAVRCTVLQCVAVKYMMCAAVCCIVLQ